MNIDWSKAPDWAYAYAQIIYKHETSAKDFAWICRDGYRVALPNDRRDDCWPYSKKTFEPDHFHIIQFRPALEQWSGEGIPPVGTVCDLKFDHWTDWERHEILCHGKTFIFVREMNSGLDREGSMSMDGIIFRPIRTPEQIAADEREKAIQLMLSELKNTECLTSHYEVCESLYQAGYRKQVTP